jgi:hypothetical protein
MWSSKQVININSEAFYQSFEENENNFLPKPSRPEEEIQRIEVRLVSDTKYFKGKLIIKFCDPEGAAPYKFSGVIKTRLRTWK